MTGRMEKSNWKILKMKMSSLSLVLEKNLPEEKSAIATVPKMAKVVGCTNTAFAALCEKVIRHIKTESIGFYLFFFYFHDIMLSDRHNKFIVLRLFL